MRKKKSRKKKIIWLEKYDDDHLKVVCGCGWSQIEKNILSAGKTAFAHNKETGHDLRRHE